MNCAKVVSAALKLRINRNLFIYSVQKCHSPFMQTFVRQFSLGKDELKKKIDALTDKFMEARELMEEARESQGTVYFSDDVQEAQEAVKVTLDNYDSLLSSLDPDQRSEVLRTIGLRMEELKAQKSALEELLVD